MINRMRNLVLILDRFEQTKRRAEMVSQDPAELYDSRSTMF